MPWNPTNQPRNIALIARNLMIKQAQVGLKPLFQATNANSVSSTWKVSGGLSILHSNLIHYFRNLSKSIRSCQIVPHVMKILQNFWLILVLNNPACYKNHLTNIVSASLVSCVYKFFFFPPKCGMETFFFFFK